MKGDIPYSGRNRGCPVWLLVDPRIQAVRVADVKAYLARRGWRLKPNPNSNLLRFEEPSKGNGPGFFQMVPASEEAADYRQRITELITTLSELEDRHPVQVLNEMLDRSPVQATPGTTSTPVASS
jgi:hypothetical protein